MKNIIIIMILSLIVCTFHNFPQENDKIILSLDDIVENKGCSIRKIKCKIIKKSLISLYFSTVKLHLFRSLLILYVFGCSQFSNFSIYLALTIFLGSSLTSLMALISTKFLKSPMIEKICYKYNKVFQIIYGMILLFGMINILICSLVIIIEICKLDMPLNKNYFIIFAATERDFTCYAPRKQEIEEEFKQLFCQAEVEISESENYYRFRIGNLYWDINKENKSDIKAMTILLYTAKRQDKSKRLTGKELGIALKYSRKLICKWVNAYIIAGNSLSTAFKRGREESFIFKIREHALRFWLENIKKNVLEIEQDLKAININANPKQIVEAMRKVDFNVVSVDGKL